MSTRDPSTRDALIAEVMSFCDRTGMAESKFGEIVFGNPSWMMRLKRGASIGIDKYDKARKFMREYKPDRQKKATANYAAA